MVARTLLALGLAAAAVAAVACAQDTKPLEDKVAALSQNVSSVQGALEGVQGKAGKVNLPSGERAFVVTGVELKGSTSTNSLAAPSVDPTTLSDGYRYKKPGDADKADATKWEVASYVWTPGDMIALQGDRVTLRVFIVNGDKHTAHIEGPDGSEVAKEQTMNRGREYPVTFTAASPGVYKFICTEHEPTMTASILVLPRG